ncbi:unnamed protein product [Phytophthora fragariaefolia]|uniref:Unnamed protein product n=1 Tax=Phytophthora fragariaefolia TaxID=1490495 RepID=A0A9W6U4G0_9STRA|nr:unnamed protein product [Phytophthora fragariaefolia]
MQTLEEKKAAEKERHRQSMARKRAEEKAALMASREEFAMLVAEQRPLLAVLWDKQQACKKRDTLSPTSVGTSPGISELSTSATKLPSLLCKFANLVELGNAIHRENAKLQQILHNYEMFESLIDRDLTLATPDQQKIKQSEVQHPPACSSGGRWLQFNDAEEPFYYKALGSTVCHDIIRECYPWCGGRHAHFMLLKEPQQLFFGWIVQRLADSGGHHFLLSKQVMSVDSAQLIEFISDEAWRIFNTSELYEQLYRSRVIMHVLQRVDECRSVILQSLPATDNSVKRHCLSLVSKMASVDKEGQLFVNILALAMKPPGGMGQQFGADVAFVQDSNVCLTFQSGGNNVVEMSLCIHGVHANDAEARFAFLESACALIRFEQLVLPRQLIPADG